MPFTASPETIAAVAALLSPEVGQTPREITRQLRETSPSSVYSALGALVMAGQAAGEGEMGKRLYRRLEISS